MWIQPALPAVAATETAMTGSPVNSRRGVTRIPQGGCMVSNSFGVSVSWVVSWLTVVSLAIGGCRTDAGVVPAGNPEGGPIPIETARAVAQPISRFLTVTGTLTPQEQADVAAEIAGRIVATPVERGTPVAAGAVLVRIAASEVEAQAREAEANAAQIQARLGQPAGEELDPDRVPEVASARATRDLTRAELDRAHMLFERQLVSQAELDQRLAQAESAQRQYEAARNGAEQQRQALEAALARVTLARKALDDTTVRAPFAGIVASRLVSVGDYVMRGTKVATVMSVHPLRVELTVPAQYMAAVDVGRTVSLGVDAYPGEIFVGRIRYISPGIQPDSRALVVEAVVPNDDSRLKPGLFVTARIEQTAPSPGVLVPAEAVQVVAGTARLFVVDGDRVEERIVTTGQSVGPLLEATSGIQAGEVVAVRNIAALSDGARVVVTP
jgi:multidrug efflux pump subunit AcrA (membrane-fusion protein)